MRLRLRTERASPQIARTNARITPQIPAQGDRHRPVLDGVGDSPVLRASRRDVAVFVIDREKRRSLMLQAFTGVPAQIDFAWLFRFIPKNCYLELYELDVITT